MLFCDVCFTFVTVLQGLRVAPINYDETHGENAWILENGEGHLYPLRGECLAMKPSYSTV